MSDYDVIVVGAGGAGMSAAIRAADAGAKVAIVEASDRPGGSTALAGGYVFASDTSQQKEQGIEDSPEHMAEYILELNGDSIPEDLVRKVSDEAPVALSWLMEIGVEYPAGLISSANGRMTPRTHAPIGMGAKIAERLDFEVSKRDIDVAFNSRVDRLATNDSGEVTGVYIGDQLISAKAVIIACGGVGGDLDLVHQMLPKSRRVGDWLWYVGAETNRGDGLRMSQEAGAQICGKDSGLFLLTPDFHRDFEVLGPGWAILVNSAGKRVVNEDGGYWELSEALEAEDDATGFYIFDHAQLENAEPDPRIADAYRAGMISLSWVAQTLKEQLEKGNIIQGESISELAGTIGVDGESLETTVNRYNAQVEKGTDDDFGKSGGNLQKISQGPFYAVKVMPALAVVMGAGPAIDEHGRVVSESGSVIPGLYAAGEVTGNVYGKYYVGSGYAIASTIGMGRIAGEEAAAYSVNA